MLMKNGMIQYVNNFWDEKVLLAVSWLLMV